MLNRTALVTTVSCDGKTKIEALKVYKYKDRIDILIKSNICNLKLRNKIYAYAHNKWILLASFLISSIYFINSRFLELTFAADIHFEGR